MTQETKKPSAMTKVLIVVGLMVAVGVAIVADKGTKEYAEKSLADADNTAELPKPDGTQSGQALPRLVDLGAGKCIPCRMMAPILEELKEEYHGKFDVVFIDVWENKSAGEEYGIRVIPTQIFFDADGKELFRHEGFFSNEDILGKWKELGVAFNDATETENGNEN